MTGLGISPVLLGVYAVFILIVAAILIFGGTNGRRHLVLAVATGGAATFLVRFIMTDLPAETQVMMQILYIPFLVVGVWLGLFLVARLRNR